MHRRSSNILLPLLIILPGSLVGFLAFKMARNNPKRAIKSTFKGTEYEAYTSWIIAMAQHETGNFKSRLFRQQNNMFGMKEARTRNTLDIDEGEFKAQDGTFRADSIGFSEFKTLKDSSDDLLLWFRFVRFPMLIQTVDNFVQALKAKSYFEDTITNYLTGVKRFL